MEILEKDGFQVFLKEKTPKVDKIVSAAKQTTK